MSATVNSQASPLTRHTVSGWRVENGAFTARKHRRHFKHAQDELHTVVGMRDEANGHSNANVSRKLSTTESEKRKKPEKSELPHDCSV
jgi:hypothetical protein